jgi:hypothetical protein
MAQLGRTSQEGAAPVADQKRQADAGRDDSRPPGHDAQRREDIEPGLVAAHGDRHQTLLDQVNAL